MMHVALEQNQFSVQTFETEKAKGKEAKGRVRR